LNKYRNVNEDSGLLGCGAVISGWRLPTFPRSIVQSSTGKWKHEKT